MNKPFPPSQINPQTKPQTKLKNPQKGKPNLDIKTDLKPSMLASALAKERYPLSPKISSEKVTQTQSKSPRGMMLNPGKPGLDILDPKEILNIDRRIYPQTTKAQTSAVLSSNFEKPRKMGNSNEKLDSFKPKDAQIKGMLSSYENVFSKKGSESKENTNLEAGIVPKSSNKGKIMEEPPKKASMPNPLSLTLNNIYTNTGSSSHRAPLNSPPSDRVNVNNGQLSYALFNRKNSQKSEVELEQQVASVILNNQQSPNNQFPMNNNFLVDIASLSSEHLKGVSRININSINNINTINNNISSGDRLPSPKDNYNSSQYNDLLRVLNEKNKEIQRLSKDKTELKSTLDLLNTEITTLKKMKVLVKEKEREIEHLQVSLNDAVRESDDLRKELTRDVASSYESNPNFPIRKTHNPSVGDNEGIQILMNQLKGLTDSSGEMVSESIEQKNHLLETITKDNNQQRLKKPDLSYNSFNFESRNERSSQPKETPSYQHDIYQRNFSETLEPFSKKVNESPYYEALKTTKKIGKSNLLGNKKTTNTKKLVAESQVLKPSTANVPAKKGESLLGTPRKPQINVEAAEKHHYQQQFKIQPSTTTGAGNDMDLFKRKFSHDPKLISEGLGGDPLAKKRMTQQKIPKETPREQHIDIGKALGSIRDRIGGMLSKHKNDHKKLQETHDLYLKKLDKLLKD